MPLSGSFNHLRHITNLFPLPQPEVRMGRLSDPACDAVAGRPDFDHIQMYVFHMYERACVLTCTDVLLSHTGYHVYDVPKQTIEEKITALIWSFGVQMIYHPLMCAIRASIILFLFRMKDYRRRIRISLHIVCKSRPIERWPGPDANSEVNSLVERWLLHCHYYGEYFPMQSNPIHLAAPEDGPVRL